MSVHKILSNYEIEDLYLLESKKEYNNEFEIQGKVATVHNMVELHNQSKLLFPSYFLRFGAYEGINEQEIEVLNVLLEAGSVMAYEELKARYGKNLSKAPDEFLVIGAQNDGNIEREILSRNYESIIERIIKRVDKRYYFKGLEVEDLIQEAFMGFLKAIEVYKIERRTKFKDFSHYVIQRHLGTLMNRSKNYRNRALNESFSYNMPVNNNNGNDTTFEELLEGSNASPEKIVEDIKTYEEIFEKLTENEQDVFKYYEKGYTYEEIAFELINDKNQINFDGMEYEEVSQSIKLYEAYTNAISDINKLLAKKASLVFVNLIEELFLMNDSAEMDIKKVVKSIKEGVGEFDFEIELDDKRKWNSDLVKDLTQDTLQGALSSKKTEQLLSTLKSSDSESKEYQKTMRKFKSLIEKELSNELVEYISETNTYSEEEIAEFVLTMDIQVLKDMEKDFIVKDIKEKFAFVNSDGMSWKDIAHEMKRKKKSVDNTIQRIRNKGHQYLEEFEDLMKKELAR